MIVYRREKFADALPDLQEIWPRHYAEVSSYPGIELNPGLDRFLMAEERGMLVLVTARDDGKLVGYALDFVMPHLHYAQITVAACDLYYILPEYRAKCARGLMRTIERVDAEMGAYARVTRAKKTNRAAAFHKAIGYTEHEIGLTKRLNRDE